MSTTRNLISASGKFFLLSFLFIAAITGCKFQEKNVAFRNDMIHSADSIADVFEKLMPDTPAEELYRVFNEFCLAHFGAETNHFVYDNFGHQLEIIEESGWEYISERSAAIAWETSLPALTYVEYGTTKRYGNKTGLPERYYYNHLHYLKGLELNRQYHYRFISYDERGNRTVSEDMTFSTKEISGAIHIPGDMGSPPYILDQENATYVITADIHADRTAFNITAGGIILDLGGHTITHGNQIIRDLDFADLERTGIGIRGRTGSPLTGLRILNGTIMQGTAENNIEYYAAEDMLRPDAERRKALARNSGSGFNNIELSNFGDVKIAGISVEYRWHQTWGMQFSNAFGKYDIHHNVFLDKGTEMFSRHGDGGSRSLGFRGSDISEADKWQIRHNLIKRTRQNGINMAQKMHNNEIYVDSWVVNSFALQPTRHGAEVHNNKIFLTGYYACGILWAMDDLNASNNLIHMENINTMTEPPYKGRRFLESWGEQDVLMAFRITNYSRGGQERNDFTYKNNIIFGRSRGNSEMRGTALYSDYSNKNIVFENNIIHIVSEDADAIMASCVSTQGAYNDRSTHLPLYYKNSTLESNICNVRFGDGYGQGSNHQFINSRIVKIGDHPGYHTFVFDGGNSNFNHVFLDCEFVDGAAYNDVYWKNTRSGSDYRIKWTLAVTTNPGAAITIVDKTGQEVYSGTVPNGQLSLPLTQSIIRPVEWSPEGAEVAVEDRHSHREYKFTPYTITAEFRGEVKTESRELNEPSSIQILF